MEAAAGTEDHSDLVGRVLKMLEGSPKYRARVVDAVAGGSRAVVIDYGDVVEVDSDLAGRVVEEPEDMIGVFSKALTIMARGMSPQFRGSLAPRFRGLPETGLWELRGSSLGRLVHVRGVVAGVKKPRMRVVKAAWRHINPVCGEMFYSGSAEKPPYCPRCGLSSGSFRLLEDESTYIEHQEFMLRAPAKEVPRGVVSYPVWVVLEGDLVGSVKPGDRVSVVGVARLRRLRRRGRVGALYTIEIYANNVEKLGNRGAAWSSLNNSVNIGRDRNFWWRFLCVGRGVGYT